jgi:hypothetical protein
VRSQFWRVFEGGKISSSERERGGVNMAFGPTSRYLNKKNFLIKMLKP